MSVYAENYGSLQSFDFKIFDNYEKSDFKKEGDHYVPKEDVTDFFYEFLQIKQVEKYNNCDIEFYFENGFGESIDYVGLLQQWYQKRYGQIPLYSFSECVRSPELFPEATSEKRFQCDVTIAPFPPFKALGKSKIDARMAAAEKAYRYLEANYLLLSLVDEVGVPEQDRAINQLQELYQKGYISEPQYSFAENHDENGNPIWDCTCYVASLNQGVSVRHSSKKQAKKNAAYLLVWLFLGEVDNHET